MRCRVCSCEALSTRKKALIRSRRFTTAIENVLNGMLASRTDNLVEFRQTGARMEKKLVKVLKRLAEHFDISLGDLLAGITLHAFEQKHASGASASPTFIAQATHDN